MELAESLGQVCPGDVVGVVTVAAVWADEIATPPAAAGATDAAVTAEIPQPAAPAPSRPTAAAPPNSRLLALVLSILVPPIALARALTELLMVGVPTVLSGTFRAGRQHRDG
ncbi:MAG: hypothetical protein M0027_00170 [Candidatus Dormibacteraeota bacterium]|nr:hypothetical protein [Candidatus Dormibacteraeota bacterium]